MPAAVRHAKIAAVDGRLPLATLLSHTLVAYTVEFDNEFEHRMPHRTKMLGVTQEAPFAPWLVSLVMWSNCMRFVGEPGLTARELVLKARTRTNFKGMGRWGYITIKPDPSDPRPKPPTREWIVRATPAGRKAQEIWQPLFAEVEERWQRRFGKTAIEDLRKSLSAIERQLNPGLPECLPILGYGLFSRVLGSGQTRTGRLSPSRGDSVKGSTALSLHALLSRVLLAFALDFEGKSELSLAIGTNVVRVLGETGARVRDLPNMAGVSKEAISMAAGILRKNRMIAVEAQSPGSRTKVMRLTAKGLRAKDACRDLLNTTEASWNACFGVGALGELRESLERLVGEPTAESSPLFRGLEPHADNWRAKVRRPRTLPHYPMVLHRGGFPDGS